MDDYQEILTVFDPHKMIYARKMAFLGEANIIEVEDFPDNVDIENERGDRAYFAVEFNSREMYNKFISATSNSPLQRIYTPKEIGDIKLEN